MSSVAAAANWWGEGGTWSFLSLLSCAPATTYLGAVSRRKNLLRPEYGLKEAFWERD
jgi:hypothetical protein